MAEESSDTARLADAMRQVQRDCADDANKVDRTPLTPRGVGEMFGGILAMIATVARAVELHLESEQRDG